MDPHGDTQDFEMGSLELIHHSLVFRLLGILTSVGCGLKGRLYVMWLVFKSTQSLTEALKEGVEEEVVDTVDCLVIFTFRLVQGSFKPPRHIQVPR